MARGYILEADRFLDDTGAHVETARLLLSARAEVDAEVSDPNIVMVLRTTLRFPAGHVCCVDCTSSKWLVLPRHV